MTTLATNGGVPSGIIDNRRASPVVVVRGVLARLREECERHVAFSETKLLLREAAFLIERLDADLTRVSAELERERAERRAR